MAKAVVVAIHVLGRTKEEAAGQMPGRLAGPPSKRDEEEDETRTAAAVPMQQRPATVEADCASTYMAALRPRLQ